MSKEKSPSATQQLAELISRFEENGKLFKSVRSALKKRFPTANELVYDYGKSIVISYTPNDKGYEGIVATSLDAKGVRMYFTHGKSLSDPKGILLGKGNQTRYIEVPASKVLGSPEVEALFKAAVKKLTTPFSKTGGGELIIKSSKKKAKGKK